MRVGERPKDAETERETLLRAAPNAIYLYFSRIMAILGRDTTLVNESSRGRGLSARRREYSFQPLSRFPPPPPSTRSFFSPFRSVSRCGANAIYTAIVVYCLACASRRHSKRRSNVNFPRDRFRLPLVRLPRGETGYFFGNFQPPRSREG